MKLSDNPETRREVRLELINWARWGDVAWLENHLIPGPSGVFRDYHPEAGDTWEQQHKPDPIDEKAAELTEEVIGRMLCVDFYARQVLILHYLERMTDQGIARFFTDKIGAKGWSKRRVMDTRHAGEQLYYDMKKQVDTAAKIA